ncbi:GntR family transcriptional regulator [Solwaraspora sp. WMMD937]|uniref:GntR family transcriptional regulator n=1 Tax=Solwaraspora sp. WMMD937 TaxID=3016090 RepID=UPI00249B994C|nr:GntR family transcriptional regulator [Solwaraspora sp. WMMD937]WFE23850.1 GntR family transcriptional regulator [Solwaraspora sp. WMMD937]
MSDVAASSVDGELESLSLVELAVRRLRREILSGKTDPGERLVEEHLTRRLGISRAPLREALRLLAEQGLVEHVPRRGVRVATLSDRDVQELYAVRDLLERHAVESVLPVRRDTALGGLRAAVDQMRLATTVGDRLRVAEAHRRFHVELVALAGNRQLTGVYESVLLKLQLYMAINLRREAEVAQPVDGVHRHERLLAAIEAGNPAEVHRELAEHGARTYRRSDGSSRTPDT